MQQGLIRFCVWAIVIAFHFVVNAVQAIVKGLWYVAGVIQQRVLMIWIGLYLLAELVGGYPARFFDFKILGVSVGIYGCIIAAIVGIIQLVMAIIGWFKQGQSESDSGQ